MYFIVLPQKRRNKNQVEESRKTKRSGKKKEYSVRNLPEDRVKMDEEDYGEEVKTMLTRKK